jgi:D-alanyl-D-alanine carboxypeptidase
MITANFKLRISHLAPGLALLLLTALGVPALAMSQAQLQSTLSGYLAHSALQGAAVGCEVQAMDGSEIYQYHAGRALIPASNVKALVSATAVELFGPQYVFGGAVFSETALKSGAVSNLYLTGCANPDGTQSLIWPLARALRDKGLKQVTGDVVGTGPLTASDHDHGLASAKRLADALAQLGVHLKGHAREGCCPAAPVLLADAPGSTLAAYLRETNKMSENHLAQCLLDSLLSFYADPAAPEPDFLLRYWTLQGLDATGMALADGSGYSRDNRLTPRFLASVLVRVASVPAEYTALSRSFPIAGVDGTLRDRMQGTAAEGCVRAKTGTLTGVSCLSGYVERKDHARVVFSLMMNGFSCSLSTAHRVQDQIAIALAQYVQSGSG